MARVTPITSCRLCGSPNLQNVLPLAPTPLGDLYLPKERHPEKLECHPLDVLLCGKCGHAQLSALVDPEDIYSHYIYTTSHSLGLPEHFRKYAEDVTAKLKLAPGSLVVDIGSNDGTLLQAFKAKGMRVQGVDPATAIAKRATENGIPTINAYFTPALAETICQQHGAADLVIANNVIANVPQPTEFFTGVRNLMAPQGHFVWETGYVRYLTEDCVFDNVHHEHIDYYAVRPLVQFYGRVGLELFDVQTTTSKGSSLRCFVRHAGNKSGPLPSVGEIIRHEEAKGYFTPAPYQQLKAKLTRTGKQLREMLGDWQKEGKKIAGYGAAIGSTTVLYEFGLAPYLTGLIDDNKVRHGLYSPGLGLRVVAPEVLAGKDRPDILVILAWRYAEPIIERNRAFLDSGGKFLKILPEIELV